jgi:hypothetical protein
VSTSFWKIAGGLAFVSLSVPLSASLNILVDQASNVILPAEPTVKEGEILKVKKGEVFHRQRLGRSNVATVGSDVTFTFLGQVVTIGGDEQLVEASASGISGEQIQAGDTLYCTAAKRTGKKRIVGVSEVNAVGMDFDAIAKLRHVQTQSCLIDTGGDGVAEKAFVADTSNRELITPVSLAPVKLKRLGLVPMPGDSEARMVFDGPVGILGNMSVSLHVVEEGKPLKFDNGQRLFNGSTLPRTVQMLGGSFTVLSYDGKTKSGQIRIDRPFAAAEYGIHTQLMRR